VSRPTRHDPSARRRGTALFAVLFLVVVATLSAASMLTASAAERTAVVRSLDELELRMAIRSALAVATADLAQQRDAMLAGETPEAPGTLRIDRGEDAPGIVVEFVSTGDGRVLRPEAARLDLNSAPASALEALPGMPAGLADAIVRRREVAPLRSVADAVRLAQTLGEETGGAEDELPDAFEPAGAEPFRGAETGDLPGGPGDGIVGDRGAADAGPGFGTPDGFDGGVREGLLGGEGSGGAWTDLVTVYAADPQVACGAVDPDRLGAALVNVNAPWSDRLERSVEEATGGPLGGSSGGSSGAQDSVRTLFINAPRLDTMGALVGLLSNQGVPPEDWRGLLDALTTTPDPFRLGLVDVNTAPAAVLASLPGLDADAAEAIVDAHGNGWTSPTGSRRSGCSTRAW
jgi:DNA uptake protein ComE-like DNA-binding protein